MALCDQLEAQTEASIDAHKTLVEVLLATLTDAKDADELNENWQTISQHFDVLFTTQASIDQLKQTILQLAVIGKLVKQNPKDEPASKLLERIATEKQQLIKDGKIKKQKPFINFDGLDDLKKPLPESWEWIKLADTADLVRGGSPRPAGDPRFYDGEIPFLKVGDVTRKMSKFVEGFNSTIKEAGLNKTRMIQVRTVLLSNSGATLGIPAICDFTATFNDGIAAFVEQSKYVFDEYLYLYLSTLSKWFLDIASQGQGQPNLNTDIIKTTWFALPPLPEQHRIVTKVDDLMALCDSFKARLNQAQTTQLDLAESIVSKAVGREIPNSEIEVEIKTMKITTALTNSDHYINQDDGILALLIKNEGGEADAKAIWNQSGFDLPSFYKQLKNEIMAGYINPPAHADFEQQ
jgi:type I restriction enzyme S subunit